MIDTTSGLGLGYGLGLGLGLGLGPQSLINHPLISNLFPDDRRCIRIVRMWCRFSTPEEMISAPDIWLWSYRMDTLLSMSLKELHDQEVHVLHFLHFSKLHARSS